MDGHLSSPGDSRASPLAVRVCRFVVLTRPAFTFCSCSLFFLFLLFFLLLFLVLSFVFLQSWLLGFLRLLELPA